MCKQYHQDAFRILRIPPENVLNIQKVTETLQVLLPAQSVCRKAQKNRPRDSIKQWLLLTGNKRQSTKETHIMPVTLQVCHLQIGAENSRNKLEWKACFSWYHIVHLCWKVWKCIPRQQHQSVHIVILWSSVFWNKHSSYSRIPQVSNV
jgi:hypothetical protein